MILKSFLLGNLVSLCMKIINSVVVVGLYYGFLTTFSIGPSYFFLLRTQVMEEGEEGTAKKVAATTGFIMGQLIMFISIYYTPLHLALGRPHTITVLALPYLLFHFFWNNHKHFFDYGSTSRNSMRNLSIPFVFLNNLIFQLFNYFILPSATLARLVNIYMFRCNNKILFVTSSFVGWLIGHILFMKGAGLVLVWIQQNYSIRSNVLIRSNKYLLSELRNSIARIFSILLFISCVYHLGRMPSPIFTKKLKETPETKESEEETDVEIEKTYETEETKQQEEGFIEENPSPSPFSEEKEDPDKIDETEKIRVNGKDKTKDEFHLYLQEASYKNSSTSYYGNRDNSETEKDNSDDEDDELLKIIKEENKNLLWFEKHPLVLLFDYKRWNRPTRYIKNDRFEKAIRCEMSQYSFYPCQNDGKQKISFTYPHSFLIFWEIIQRNLALATTEKFNSNSDDELYNYWIYTNKEKKDNLSNEFTNRIRVLDKGFFDMDVFDKKTRLCNDNTKQEFLQKTHDPLLNGSYRGIIKNTVSSFINETKKEKLLDDLFINKIHSILHNDYNYQEFEDKKNPFDIKLILPKIRYFVTLMSQRELTFNHKKISLVPEQGQAIDSESENETLFFNFLVDTIIADSFTQTIPKKYIGIKEINKEIPRWSYKLIDEIEQYKKQIEENVLVDHQIRSRKAKRVVIYTDKQENTENPSPNTVDKSEQPGEIALIRYSQQSDFRRDIIQGSMRVQRRKIVIWKFFQANIHSPLFLNRIDKSYFVNFSKLIKRIFQNWMGKTPTLKNSDYKDEELKEKKKREKAAIEEEKRKEQIRIDIAEAWDTIPFAQIIRGLMLITQSIIRKSILLPLLIIAKNIGRILLFQSPEWAKDFNEWNNEMHVKCTYNGVQLSETEFPKNWLTDGIQIKIFYPFCLKPWHKSMTSHRALIKQKEQNEKENYCFLTVCGTETDFLFGPSRKHPPFFQPIFKQLRKKIRKLKKNRYRFGILKVIHEKFEFFLKCSNETKNRIIEIFLFLTKKRKKISTINPVPLVGFRKESSERKKDKDSKMNNHMMHESSIQTPFLNWTTSSVTEKKIKDLSNRTKTIKNQIEKISKDNIKINSILNKTDYRTKRFESSQNMGQILKRKNARLIRKSNSIWKFFREKIYIDIFVYIINIPRINTQLFLESTKKWIDKSSSNNETNHERSDKTNINIIKFISTLKKDFLPFLNNNFHFFSDFYFLSQAYVFYQLSQAKIFNLKSVLQYPGISLFLKKELQDYFVTQGIAHSELHTQKLPNYGINRWKNWLKSKNNYHYDLPQIKWSQLVPQKWRNKVTEHCEVENLNLQQNKRNSYQKEQLINYKKNNSENYLLLLPDQNSNFTKNYRYDVLSSKFFYYKDTNDSYRYSYGIPFEVKKNQEFSYIYNYKKNKDKLIDMWWNIQISNYLGIKNIMDIEKNTDRKYLDFKILHFCLRKKVDIEDISTSMNENRTTESKNYQIVDKIEIDKKGLFYHTIDQEINRCHQKKKIFDWMGMNEEILSRPISELESWFFSEFALFYNSYKMKPWIIPINFLFSNSNGSENLNENKNITRNKKTNTFRQSNEKKSFELKKGNQNEDENETVIVNEDENEIVIATEPGSNVQKKYESDLSNEQEDIEKDYIGSDMTMPRKRQKPKTTKRIGLRFLLKKYLLFQLRWGNSMNQKLINNIKVYCLQLRLINPIEITIASLERNELSMDILLLNKDLTLEDLIQKGILIVEPIRRSVKNDGLFILYQTICISLVHKSKHQNNQQKYRENIDKKKLDLLAPENILSPRHRRELRILICLNLKNNNGMNTNPIRNRVKNSSQFFDKNKNVGQDKNTLRKFKFLLWPNYRLEDLACMNRCWFDTNNGSRFSILRMHMYPQFKIHL
uniref:Ycf1 protein n=1 Tax=Salicornia ramosissima TaxID=267548 RepID=UPI0021823D14|nr:Ycf1 protein [Salicornia ramosissima]UVF34075.1 Ycf1 protein [Salicornia ramosissima]